MNPEPQALPSSRDTIHARAGNRQRRRWRRAVLPLLLVAMVGGAVPAATADERPGPLAPRQLFDQARPAVGGGPGVGMVPARPAPRQPALLRQHLAQGRAHTDRSVHVR
jgi:hypothetical protein